jgi:hypothetical protein
MGISSPLRRRPLIFFSKTAYFVVLPRNSSMRMKRKGERGSPCMMPQVSEKMAEGDPLMSIEKKDKEVRDNIHLIHRGEKPKANKTCWMYYELSLSKALDILILMSILEDLVILIEWMISWSIIMSSRIWHPLR